MKRYRRQVLLSAAAGSILPQVLPETAAAEQVAISEPSAKVVESFTTAIKDPTSISSQHEQTQYSVLLNRLREYNAWPKTFDTSLEAGVSHALAKIAAEEQTGSPNKLTHNPRLVEPLLGEISSLLDRCLSYRREAADLEIQGVAGGIARIQADALAETDKSILEATAAKYVAHLIAINYPEVAKLFGEFGTPSNRAHSLEASVQAKGNQRVAEVEGRRLGLALGRLKFVYELDRKRLSCQDVLGNAYNFGQRHCRVRKLFESDITAAYRRAIAAALGLSQIFSYTDPQYTAFPWLPDLASRSNPDAGDFLDDFVIWTRNAMRAVALIGENEVEYVEQIFCRMGADSQEIQLGSYFDHIKYVRLRSVAASYILNKDALSSPEKSQATFRLVITRKEELGQPSGIGPQPIIFIPNVRVFGSQNQPEFVEATSLYNMEPRGTWIASLSGKGGTVGPVIFVERKEWVEGFVLYMRVVGVIDTAQNKGGPLTNVLLRN